MRFAHAFTALVIAAPAASLAQAPAAAALVPGAPVRALVARPGVHLGSGYTVITGSLERIDGDSVAIRVGDAVTALPSAAVTRLDVREGTVTGGRAALRGAGIGLGIGFASGFAIG